MKKILIIFLSVCALVSCEKDETMMTISGDPAPAVITSHDNGFTKVITEDVLSENITFEWAKADYGVNTQVTYALQIDAEENGFSLPVVLGTTQNTSLTLSLEELNQKLISQVKVTPNVEAPVQLRVVSTINDQLSEISEVIAMTFTAWKSVAPAPPATLWVPGGYQGWNPGVAPVIYANSETEYEGYVYIQEGTGFKFTSSPDWDHINYGDSGTPGVLTTDGLANGMSASEPGYYYFKVNTQALTYEMYRVESFGLIGTATPGGWNTSTTMDFNPATKLFTKTVELSGGALKFRANNDWAHNYGPENSDALNGTLTKTDAAITIADAGVYTITLDLTRTQAPYKFSYKVEKGSVSTTPAKLSVPGEYQAWTPSSAPVIYAINENEFEGYIYIAVAGGFKFTSAPDWDHVNYGDGGGGNLSTDPLAGDLSVAETGYYRVKVNTSTLKYEIYKVNSFGVIGTATPGSWDNSTPMTYDPETGLWSVSVDLVNGALKFRANNSWDVNYGPSDSNALSGTLMQTDAAISISEPGNYTVTLDMSRSVAPWKYSYSVIKN
jgi:starch-binding outer membrane protein SusE/F